MALESTGFIDFAVGDESFKTWYRVVGDLQSGVRPLVALHGGPGIPNPYMFPLEALNASHGIPVIFYDQLGAGNSTHLPNKPKSFWTVDLFMNELDNLLVHFGISDNFSLVGHSWGGMLGSNYAAARRPAGLKSLVLSSSPASMALWVECMNGLLMRFPESVRELVKRCEREGDLGNKEYEETMTLFNNAYLCKMNPWPKPLLDSLAAMSKNPAVTEAMVGFESFECKASMKDWSVVDIVHRITCPTLVTNGVDDEAQWPAIQPFVEKIPKVKWVRFDKSSHVALFEEQERYLAVVGDFLASV